MSIELVNAWVKLQYLDRESSEYDTYFWSFDEMADLAHDDPKECWRVIESIIELDASDKVLSNLGAGPVEDLLSEHGSLVIEWLEQASNKNPAVGKMLGCVWRNSIPENIWERVQKIAAPSW